MAKKEANKEKVERLQPPASYEEYLALSEKDKLWLMKQNQRNQKRSR